LDQTVPSPRSEILTLTFGSAFWRLADIQQSPSLSSFFLLDIVGEQKCRAILDLDITEDMELHHHSSTHPSRATTRRIRGSLVSGAKVDIFADLRITAHLHHKRVDMATHNPHLHSNRTGTLR
jgi:hypothetical protein